MKASEAMTWNYRVVKYAEPDSGYGLHEVHYDKDGKEKSMTQRPCGFVGDSPQEICGQLLTARVDAAKRPVFNEPSHWRPVITDMQKDTREEGG